MQKLTDNSIMAWGKFKGEKMVDVPASYLLWLLKENKCDRQVREYIEDNKQVLETEIENERR